MGVAAALPAIVEVPVFGASRSLVPRLGLRMLYVWGALVAALLTLLVAMAPEAWMVTALRTLDGTSYAMRYMAMVVIVAALLPRYLHAVGQSEPGSSMPVPRRSWRMHWVASCTSTPARPCSSR